MRTALDLFLAVSWKRTSAVTMSLDRPRLRQALGLPSIAFGVGLELLQTMLAAEAVGLPSVLRAERRVFRDTHSAYGVFDAGLLKLEFRFHFVFPIKKQKKKSNQLSKLGCRSWH
jgi:hypothetical protein